MREHRHQGVDADAAGDEDGAREARGGQHGRPHEAAADAHPELRAEQLDGGAPQEHGVRVGGGVLDGELEVGRGRGEGGGRGGDAEAAGVGQRGDVNVEELAREELRREFLCVCEMGGL